MIEPVENAHFDPATLQLLLRTKVTPTMIVAGEYADEGEADLIIEITGSDEREVARVIMQALLQEKKSPADQSVEDAVIAWSDEVAEWMAEQTYIQRAFQSDVAGELGEFGLKLVERLREKLAQEVDANG
jgi:hypothetical protein